MKKKLMYILLTVPVALLLVGIAVGFFVSAPGYKGNKGVSFNGKVFKNYDGVEAKGFGEVLKWAINREQGKWIEIDEAFHSIPERSSEKQKIYFVNHSTFLIQWNGINILTDPIWSDRTSPFSFAGPKRMRPPGIFFDHLPKIDLVILSHNHYDHLDLPTIEKLWKRDNPLFIVPLGVDELLKNKELEKITALDWWESVSHENFVIELVPAQHFSGRGLADRDKTLWGGYMISDGNEKLYFAGDTGYNKNMFDDIHQKHPEIDVALLPIGAYKPQWFMSPIHISPEEAIIIHKQLKIKKSIGMHYGTFPLADDGQDDPLNDLNAARKTHEVSKEEFLLLEEGHSM